MIDNSKEQSKSAKFVEWMLKNKNIHTANMQAMDRAISIVEQQDNDRR